MNCTLIRRPIVATIAVAAMILPASLAHADASAWEGDTRASMRIVSGEAQVEDRRQVMRAGVEIRLATGWKTYWRYPGDSGIPPHFDFGQSENVKAIHVSWPAPQRMDDASGSVIGYRDAVLFPLRIEPRDPTLPIVLRLALDYAICEKVCIPVQARSELTIKGGGTADAAIAAAEKTVPRAQPLGAAGAFSVTAIHHDQDRKPARVVVDIAAPAGIPVTVFVEGPSADWALPIPQRIDGPPGGPQRFAFDLDGLPPGARADGATLKLTAVAGSDAIETTFRLD